VSSLVLDDELSFVDLFLVHLFRINIELILDHFPGNYRADRASAIDTDHDDIIKIHLLTLGEFIERHHVAALDCDTDLHVPCPIVEFLDELGQKKRPAVERSGRAGKILGIGDQDRFGIIEVHTPSHNKDSVDHLGLERILPQGGHGTAKFRLLLDLGVIGP